MTLTEIHGDLLTIENVTKLTSLWVQDPRCSFLCCARGTGRDFVLTVDCL